MALPSSGSISMSQVKAETGLASNSIRAYAAYYNLNIPDSMTEFLGIAGTGYTISPNLTSVNEGSAVIWTITTTNLPNGTILYWTNGGTTNASDFTDNSNSGTITINGNTGTLTRSLNNDTATEGTETIIIRLHTISTSGTIVATSSTVTVNDTSKAPSYAIAPDKTSVNETDNKTVTWTITTSDVQNGTNLYWINVGSTDGSDFTETNNSGMVTIQNNGASFSKTLIPDNASEGSETIIIELRTVSTSGTTVATAATVTVDDTSACPADGTYISDFCGGTNNWNYYWVVANGSCGTRNELKDEYSETNCGFVRVSATFSVGFDDNGTGVIFINSMSDGSGVGRQFSVNNGITWYDYPANTSVGGLSLGTSYNLAIRDSSNKGRSYLNITTPTFSISPNRTSVNETTNRTVTWTINTTNLQNTSLYWVNTGSTTGDDFEDGINEAFISINNNIATFSKTLKTDKFTEGGESIIIVLKTGLGGSVLASADTVNVADTSKTPTYSISANPTTVNEGDTVTWTVNTTDVDDGTYLYVTNQSNSSDGTDFEDGANQAFVIINSGTGTFSKTLRQDSTSEGQETIEMALRINSYSGQIQAYSNTVYVNDTSVCPTAGTILYTYCGGTNNWSLIGQIADGFCGSNPSVLEEYSEDSCGYVRVSASWTTSPGCIENIVMSNGTGQERRFSVNNGATFYDYFGNDSVCGLSGTINLIITDSSGKGANYSINIPATTTTTTTTTAAPCRTFEIEGYNENESVNGVYTNCAGFPDSFSFFGGPGIVGSICAQASSAYVTSGNGVAIDVGPC